MRKHALAGVVSSLVRARLVVRGVVQGVGFRPYVYRLARDLGLRGWVLNSTEGVVIEVEGDASAVDEFARDLPLRAPPRATIDRIDRAWLPPLGYVSFGIEQSEAAEGQLALVSPDIATCPECLAEVGDPGDRRHRYPFTNCTNCGPRFTIVRNVPYDRPTTTMACFPMCPACAAEYADPASRRFHAQPNACPACGPSLWIVDERQEVVPPASPRSRGPSSEALARAARLLSKGAIVAVKGLGGFHLACDAAHTGAVAELRRRKRRTDKPFAVMFAGIGAAGACCYVSSEESQLLESPQRPIVLLRRREDAPLSPLVAPHSHMIGAMLPYTPLHHLLLEEAAGLSPGERRPLALVMTSGNLSEEPIATGNREALERLGSLADAFLLHDRDVLVRCDDSVTRVFRGKEAVVRRSRGYAPFPVRLGFEARQVLACGPQLKSTFCVTKGDYAFLSQHIGDLENEETLAFFASSLDHFRRVFRLEPEVVACDLHLDYLSTAFAREFAAREGLPLLAVQHHHAHVVACLAENGVDRQTIGVAFDGTGYGPDGTVWGGEFLLCDQSSFRRVAHLKQVPMPGGEAAIRHPWRMAASYLRDALGPGDLGFDLPPLKNIPAAEVDLLCRQLERGVNSPLTSSIGRLFDAVSSIAGIRHSVNYEGQAAIELEMVAGKGEEGQYEWSVGTGDPMPVDMAPAICEIVGDVRRGAPAPVVSARFHNTVAGMIASVCGTVREKTGVGTVALSGGVFQNMLLLERAVGLLERGGFRVLTHHQVPANDGGVSLGQAVVAARWLNQATSNQRPGDRCNVSPAFPCERESSGTTSGTSPDAT